MQVREGFVYPLIDNHHPHAPIAVEHGLSVREAIFIAAITGGASRIEDPAELVLYAQETVKEACGENVRKIPASSGVTSGVGKDDGKYTASNKAEREAARR